MPILEAAPRGHYQVELAVDDGATVLVELTPAGELVNPEAPRADRTEQPR